MKAEPAMSGFNPPQQARSRRALDKVLVAAEDVLARDGFAEFTMAAVASHAGVSIGAIYRRFEGKDQLLAAIKDRMLSRHEQSVAERLQAAEPNLAGVLETFTKANAEALAAGSRVFPDLLRSRGTALEARGLQALSETRRLYWEAVGPYIGEVRRPDPLTALEAVRHTIIGSCIHRASLGGEVHGMPWDDYADQLSDMVVTYLLAPERPPSAG